MAFIYLNHLIGAGCRLSGFRNPSLHNSRALRVPLEKMRSRYQRGTRNLARAVDHRLLHVTLNGTKHGRVDDPRQHAEGIGAVQVHVARHILRQTRRDDDHVVGVARFGNIFDEEVNHPTKGGVVAHEELRHAEEDIGGLSAVEVLPRVSEVQELSDDRAALSGALADRVG